MFKTKTNLLFILAVLSIFILIPSSFAMELNESQAVACDDLTQDIVAANDDVIYVSPTASEGNGSQANPYDLATAVSVYDSNVNSKIIMQNGEYKFTNQLNLDKTINIEGESFNGVILNGSGVSSILRASSGNIVLSNLTFVNGYSEYDPFSTYEAGGLHIGRVNHILIDGCIFENNTASAITAGGANALIDIQNCEFNGNHVDADWAAKGGAINFAADSSELNIVNSIFKNNYLDNGHGGAIYGQNNFKSLVIDGCEFINNTAPGDGSAISAYCGGDVSVLNTKFINQTSPVIYDEQRNAVSLNLFVKNITFDNQSGENIVIEGKVNLVYLDSNDRISGNDIRMDFGDDENYTVTLTDGEGNPIDGKEIIVTLTDYYEQVTVLNSTTNSNGQAIFSMKNQTPGRYKVVASFEGDEVYNNVNTTNSILIKAEELYTILMIPNSIKVKEGESYTVYGVIADEYYEPTYYFDGVGVDVEFYNPTKMSLGHTVEVEEWYFTFDIAKCGLKTNQTPYVVTFILDPESYEGELSFIQGTLTADLSTDVPDIGDRDVIYVATNGNDTTGNGSKDNPLASVQMALIINNYLGGGKTIVVGEGTYNISNFNIGADVTIIGNKSKTVFKQDNGNQGMFKIMNPVTVNLINLTLTDGYTTPQPYSLITAYGEGVLVNVDGCEFKNNTCFNGGAIAISHGAYVYVNNSKFIDNRAILSQSTAGAIFVLDGYLKVTQTEFINNTASCGGAIWVGYSGKVDIIDSTFIDNKAYNDTLIVVAGGGAVYTRGITSIRNSTFIQNHADLFGGAVYISSGETTISKSYFENNSAGSGYDASIKGSAIEGESFKTYTLNVEYSIFLTNDRSNYIALFSNSDDATINLDYNYWGRNTWYMMNTNLDVFNYAIIQPRSETDPVYKDTNSSIIVEFMNFNAIDGTVFELKGFVHDYTVDVSSVLNDVNATSVTIVNNFAKDDYYPVNVGSETVLVNDARLSFDVVSSVKKDVEANITVTPGNTTKIVIEVPTDLENNISVSVKDHEFSQSAGNGTIVIEVDALPGDYKVIVSYTEDKNYKGFSNTTLFTVAKFPSGLNVTATSVLEGQSVTVDVNITEGASGEVIIILNGKYRYPVEISDGKAFKIFYELEASNYTVEVIYEGDDYYEGCNGTAAFEVAQRPPEPVEPIDGYAYISVQTGEITTITVRVPTNLTDNVTITVNDDVYSRESGDGEITFNITAETGDYTVFVNYDGDMYYNEFSGFKTFKIYDKCWFINETGYRTLREAVEAANDGDIIKGNVSVYEIDETIAIGHREMPSEPWEVVKNVTITSMGDKPVTIKGSSKRLFYIDKDSHLTLSNLILAGSDVGVLDGGAVENLYDAYVTIENCTFANFTADRGGALFLWGQAQVRDSVFINNFANLGGAIFILSPVTNDNTVILDNITVINNAAESYGAGVYVSGSFSNSTIIRNSQFTNNSCHGKGGAMFVTYGNVIIDNVVFDSNSATDYDFENEVEIAGGALYVSKYVNANISNSRFISNYAGEYAGAIGINNAKVGFQDLTTGELVEYCYTTNIVNCTFTNNTAETYSGAIYVGFDEISTVNIADSIFDSNKAKTAIVSNNFGVLTIKGSEFTNNIVANTSLIVTYGFYYEEAFNAETEIIDCNFHNNDVVYDIVQYNSYTNLVVEYCNFTDDAAVLLNYGSATLNGVVQSEGNNNYSIANANKLSLSKNKFADVIINNARILTDTYIIVLGNETQSVEVDTVFNLKAIVCDDNGNLIEFGNLTFLVDGDEINATYHDKEFSANYTIESGQHTVTARYSDEGLSNLLVKTAVLIGKKSPDMTVAIDDIEFGENAIITVNVDSNAGGNVTVKIVNETYELTVKNGEAKFHIPDLAIGQYPIEITYSGDDIFASKTQSAVLTVSKVASYPFVVDVTNITTDGAVVDITLPEDFSGEVIAIVDLKSQNVSVRNGKATIPLTDLTIGIHNVEIMFAGNEKYANSTAKTSFKLSKLDSYVKIFADDVVVGNDAVIDLIVPADATGDIIVNVNGKEYIASVFNGKARLTVSNLGIGKYDVDALYLGSDLYLDSSDSASFNVIDEVTVKMSVFELNITQTTIKGILKDSEGNPISNTVVGYAVDGADANVTTNADGSFEIDAKYGVRISIRYDGDDARLPIETSVILNDVASIRTGTVVLGSNFTQYAIEYGAGERGQNFTVQLKDANGNVLVNKTVLIGYNGKTLVRTTDGNGYATVQINLKDANRLTFAVAFLGDDEFAASMSVYLITINKKPVTISAAAKSYKASATKKYTVTLKTIKGASADGKTYFAEGKKVTMKIDGKTYTTKTKANGQATFTLKITKKGKYTATISYAGDTTYKSASKSVKLTIK